MQYRKHAVIWGLALIAAGHWGCDKSTGGTPDSKSWKCVLGDGAKPNYLTELGCQDDFTALASEPLDVSIPGAVSLKTVVDRADSNKLYFQNSQKYAIHHEFASANLSGKGLPTVPSLATFNQTEYYSPERRFILGAVTYYQGPKKWTFELSPYDKASAAFIELAYTEVAKACFCGDSLYFHPTSEAIEVEAKGLSSKVKIITTNQLYAGIDYQPLNFGTSYGRLIFTTAKNLETQYVSFRDIVVLDEVPNDISVTSGIITQQFQTPLSHINVLSQNRGTPNMALRGAFTKADLLALKDKWVKFVVGPSGFSVTEVTKEVADAWWEEHRPATVGVPKMDLDMKEMKDIEDVLALVKDSSTGLYGNLGSEIKKAIPAFGGKASHFAAFPHMDSTKIRYPKAFAIPVYYYWQFMEQNGFNDSLEKMYANPAFEENPAVRDSLLKGLRKAMKNAPVDSGFEATLMAKIKTTFPGINRIRFRSSTNAEDLDGFTGAGLYDSKTGGIDDPSDPILGAVKEVWASVWYFRAYEERSYRNIDHKSVGMALLVHSAFSEEEANGVAITANPFDLSGLEPGFYINAQVRDELVVSPDASTTADQFIYYYDNPDQPIVFIAHSSLVTAGSTVLTAAETFALGTALKEIHTFFQPVYGKDASKWFAMDTEFKLDQPAGADPSAKPVIFMKQARPYPGFGNR